VRKYKLFKLHACLHLSVADICTKQHPLIQTDVRIDVMNDRSLKDLLYEQVARVGKALSSPKRLEILEMLAQGEKAVETISAEVAIDNKLASAHLKALREARLVQTRRDGKRIFYSLTGNDVAQLGVTLRQVAEEHLVELRMALQQMMAEPDGMVSVGRKELMLQAKRGEIIVLDVRPQNEYATAHLPHARSLPVNELKKRLNELPKDVPVVAYCRGPFCLMAKDAVEFLRNKGYRAFHLTDGVAEWRSRGLPIEQSS
jgi:rhodanese-related sulfurtransferase/DNA-binding transcriptional ArsR family regulator